MTTTAISTIPPCHLFVATDVECREFTTPGHDDVMSEGKCFRRLSPDYYAWLRHQMERARHQHARGMIPDAQYDALRRRFNTMHDRAVALFGEETLLHTLRTFTPETYPVPSVRWSQDVEVLLRDAEVINSTSSESSDASSESLDPRVGMPVRNLSGSWHGRIIRTITADAWFPNGRAEIRLDNGQLGQADLRSLRHADGTPLVEHPSCTAYEQRAVALSHEEKAEDFADLEASLPILSFVVPGHWRFEEKPSFDDYLKVNGIRERAHTLGWTDADLFQTCGRFKYPGGQDYGLVCFLRGRMLGEMTADHVALLPDKPGGAVLTFHRPHRSIAQQEMTDGPIHEAVLQCGADFTEAVA